MSITVKHTILPAAVFIIVETVLVAETILVVLLDEISPRSPGAAPIAILLSVALLVNLGLVCGVAAALAADSERRSRRARARDLIDSFPAVSAPVDAIESAALSSPACGVLPGGGHALPMDSEDQVLVAAGHAR